MKRYRFSQLPIAHLLLVLGLSSQCMGLEVGMGTAVGSEYNRKVEFGSGWLDLDGDGCNTRDEVLERDAIQSSDNDGDGCVDQVVILDPYTGQKVAGRSEIDIDHVVSLYDASASGSDSWTKQQRLAFANDVRNYPGVLLATSDNENASKGDRGPDRWRPNDPAQWCNYAVRYREIKLEYGLTTTPKQQAGLNDLLETCDLSGEVGS